MAVVRKGGYEGIIDKSGNVVVPIEYLSVGSFFEGRAVVFGKDERSGWNLYGAVDETGRLVVPMEYSSCSNFINSFAIVSKRDRLNNRVFGVIDRDGNVLIPLEYDKIERVNGAGAEKGIIASKKVGDKSYQSFWRIENGEAVCTDEYYRINSNFFEGMTWVQQHDGKWGFIDTSGECGCSNYL